MILLIDNYESFTYNLYQMIGIVNENVKVIKNDELTTEKIEALSPTHIINAAGEVVEHFKGKVPMLGIGLGHQAICEAFGATVTCAQKVMHGKQSFVHIANGSPLFRGLAPVIEAARYHSLIVKRDTLGDDLLVIAEDDAGEVMGVKHKLYDIYGLQFQPESILTKSGNIIVENFLSLGGAK